MTFKVAITYLIYVFTAIYLVGLSKVAFSKDAGGFSFDGQLEAFVGNDNNVVIEEIDLTTSTSDTFFTFKAKGGFDYNFDQQHSVTAALSYTDKSYSDADRFDLQTTLSTVGYKFKHESYTINFDYRKADAELGGNDFLVLTQISPAVSFFLTKKSFFRLAYTNIEKELVNNPVRDASSDEFGLDYYFFWNGLNDYFISSIRLRQEDAQDPIFDFQSYQLRFAYKKRFELMEYSSRLSLDAKYRTRDFDTSINPSINAFRVDKRRSLSVSNELEVFDSLFWTLALEYVNNDSNLDTASFSETEVITGILYQF
ncbi:DUF560 domain-containing protein [Glaciecola sp. XM2]|uniref:surface lipoprotein assembly modifier n=1 Tax=Glaciecola sp. XM2 TaxID=1914931 RepID=UPI001BDDD8A8|nr:surface lipoprotein assembly modifier [Glaciecola sp. XM2]MBT1450095.1 DUF560 domain-containing protein [Glaciecola sp. XM2]